MTRAELILEIRKKSSMLCVGLDTDIKKIPKHLLAAADPVFEFNKAIIDATADLCVAYKPNLAFYEELGPAGLESLKKTIDYLPGNLFTIGDAKRGDIGNTGQKYARAYFEFYGFDAITVSPLMGRDSVEPFLAFPGKWTILLALTSNPGSADFQLTTLDSGRPFFEKVISASSQWAGPDQLMYVVGATRYQSLKAIRNIIPDHFLLIPGIGAQGGDLEEVIQNGRNADEGLIINASRSILYADDTRDFYKAARKEASSLAEKMKKIMENFS